MTFADDLEEEVGPRLVDRQIVDVGPVLLSCVGTPIDLGTLPWRKVQRQIGRRRRWAEHADQVLEDAVAPGVAQFAQALKNLLRRVRMLM